MQLDHILMALYRVSPVQFNQLLCNLERKTIIHYEGAPFFKHSKVLNYLKLAKEGQSVIGAPRDLYSHSDLWSFSS